MKKKREVKFQYQNYYTVYFVMGLIIILLSIFLISNFGKCKIYSLSTSDSKYKVANGVLVMTNQKNILKLSNIEYYGDIENIVSVSLDLCVDMETECDTIATMSSNAAEGMNLPMYLEKISFDLNEENSKEIEFTSKVKRRIVKELYLEIEIITLEGEKINDLVKVDVDKQYSNNKLFY